MNDQPKAQDEVTILDRLSYVRIFDVEFSKDRKSLIFTEACHNYYSAGLTQTQVIELANALHRLANQMEAE